MNRNAIKEKYKNFIPEDLDKFKHEIEFIYDKIQFGNLNNNPLLIYSQNKRNTIYYLLSAYYSLKLDRILDYGVITGQTLINQHFMSDINRDKELHNKVYYSDITFVSLSQYDYTNEYLESQIIDLIEFRHSNKKLTVLSYDIMSSGQNYIHLTKKLHAYFLNSHFQIVDITENKNVFDKSPVNTATPKKKRIQ